MFLFYSVSSDSQKSFTRVAKILLLLLLNDIYFATHHDMIIFEIISVLVNI